MMDDFSFALVLCGVFLLAGLVKGLLGLGLPTVAMGLLGLVMPPVQAAALLLVPSLVTNVWQVLTGATIGPLLRRFWPMMVGIVGGTVASSGIIAGAGSSVAGAGLGVALVSYGVAGLLLPPLRVSAAAERWAGPVVGLVTGVVTGATGVFVVPAVPFLGSLGLERDDLVQALGLSFTVSTLALAGGLALQGALPIGASGASLATSAGAVVPALVGMWIGGWLRSRVRPAWFRQGFFAGLVVLGGELVWHGVR